MKRFALLGATRGMGRAIARILAERGDALCVLGRDPAALERTCADLAVRNPSGQAHHACCDLRDPTTFAAAIRCAREQLQGLDGVILTAAVFQPQHELEANDALRDELLRVDFLHTVQFCEAARSDLLAHGGGTLCVFSSVAGDRGRASVRLYGAAKAGLSHYLESLDHADRRAGLTTICVKPGFVHTDMTAALRPPPFAGEPTVVARRVVRALDRGQPVVYAPAVWRWVMSIVRHLPRWLMRRVGF